MVGRLQLNVLCHYNEECINFISEALSETAFIHFFFLLFIKLPSFSALKSYTALFTINLRGNFMNPSLNYMIYCNNLSKCSYHKEQELSLLVQKNVLTPVLRSASIHQTVVLSDGNSLKSYSDAFSSDYKLLRFEREL